MNHEIDCIGNALYIGVRDIERYAAEPDFEARYADLCAEILRVKEAMYRLHLRIERRYPARFSWDTGGRVIPFRKPSE